METAGNTAVAERPPAALDEAGLDLYILLVQSLERPGEHPDARRERWRHLRAIIDERLGMATSEVNENDDGPARGPKPMILAQETATYEARLPELLAHRGEYVLIKGDEVLGFFPESELAERFAYQRLGFVPFFIKEIQPTDRVYYIPGVVP